ncbi:hypothetical protein [Endozoicomonas sp. Mp262]|uniref:hypothetical protein n=1 Tax=Endozoicomonas sp. Mp262 TaxID=2919499 RepID=UPI0021DB4B0A
MDDYKDQLIEELKNRELIIKRLKDAADTAAFWMEYWLEERECEDALHYCFLNERKEELAHIKNILYLICSDSNDKDIDARFDQIDSTHHKTWDIDQMARTLTGERSCGQKMKS